MYDLKNDDYFGTARVDIAPLIEFPRNANILEIGCGNGSTLVWLKKNNFCAHATGIDAFASKKDSSLIDEFIQFNLNEGIPIQNDRKFDAILCLDVLEHLIDPWKIIKQLKSHLTANGQLIVSLPNIQSYRVVFSLFFKGNFDYQDEGILDKTHLRFFTKKTAIRMLEEAGFSVVKVIAPEKKNLIKRICGLLGINSILHKQFIYSCTHSKP